MPCNSERRLHTLSRKRKEYADAVNHIYSRGIAGLDQEIWHQVPKLVIKLDPYRYSEDTPDCAAVSAAINPGCSHLPVKTRS